MAGGMPFRKREGGRNIERQGQTISEIMGRGQRRKVLKTGGRTFGGEGGARNVGGRPETITPAFHPRTLKQLYFDASSTRDAKFPKSPKSPNLLGTNQSRTFLFIALEESKSSLELNPLTWQWRAEYALHMNSLKCATAA